TSATVYVKNSTIEELEGYRCSIETVEFCSGHFLFFRAETEKKIISYTAPTKEQCTKMKRDLLIDNRQMKKTATDRFKTDHIEDYLPSRTWFSDNCRTSQNYILERGVIGILDDSTVMSPLFYNANCKLSDGECTQDDARILWKVPDIHVPRCRLLKVGEYQDALVDSNYVIMENHQAAFRFDPSPIPVDLLRCFKSPPHLTSTGAFILFEQFPNIQNMSAHLISQIRRKREIAIDDQEQIDIMRKKFYLFIPPFITVGVKELDEKRCDKDQDRELGNMFLKYQISRQDIHFITHNFIHDDVKFILRHLLLLKINYEGLQKFTEKMPEFELRQKFQQTIPDSNVTTAEEIREIIFKNVFLRDTKLPGHALFNKEIAEYLGHGADPVHSPRNGTHVELMYELKLSCYEYILKEAAANDEEKEKLARHLLGESTEDPTRYILTSTEFSITELLQSSTTLTSTQVTILPSTTIIPSTTILPSTTIFPSTTILPSTTIQPSTIEPYIGYGGSASEINYIKKAYDQEEDARQLPVNVSTLPGEKMDSSPILTMIDFKSPGFYESIRTSSFPTKLAVSFGQQIRSLRLQQIKLLDIIEQPSGFKSSLSLINSTSNVLQNITNSLTGQLLEKILLYGGIGVGVLILFIILICGLKLALTRCLIAKVIGSVPINRVETVEMEEAHPTYTFQYSRSLAVNAVSSSSAPHIPITINDRVISALWDTGSSATFFKHRTATSLGISTFSPTSVKAIGVGGQEFKFIGKTLLPIEIGGLLTNYEVMISNDKDCPAEALIGTDFMKSLERRGVTPVLELLNRRLLIGDTKIPFVDADCLFKETTIHDVYCTATVTIPAGKTERMKLRVDLPLDNGIIHEIIPIMSENLQFDKFRFTTANGVSTEVLVKNKSNQNVTIHALSTIGVSNTQDENLHPYCPKELLWNDRLPEKKELNYDFMSELNLSGCKLTEDGKKSLKEIIRQYSDAFFTGNGQP
ncbi:hypothetical protein PENTCL1PPCAC_30734, partial [Pristionchus entomophagus]